MRSGRATALLLVAALVLACVTATPKAYPGPTLDLSQLAVVRGAVYVEAHVGVQEIDGMEQREDWSASYQGDIHLPPGSYELAVRFQRSEPVGLMRYLIPWLLVKWGQWRNPGSRPGREYQQTIRVAVEAGYTYTVNFDKDNTSYFVVRSESKRPDAK